jgi:hypothetical protein
MYIQTLNNSQIGASFISFLLGFEVRFGFVKYLKEETVAGSGREYFEIINIEVFQQVRFIYMLKTS